MACQHCGIRDSGWRDEETGDWNPPRAFEARDVETGETVEVLTLCAPCYSRHARTTPGVTLKPLKGA